MLFQFIQVYLTSNTNSEANGETYHSNDSSNTSWSYIKIYNLNGLSAQDKETVAHEYVFGKIEIEQKGSRM